MMTRDFFIGNRQRLGGLLQGGVAVFSAYTEMQRSNDMSFLFEQEANFWWLSGIDSADWWIICDFSQHKTWAVAPVVSESRHIFDGSLSFEEAKEKSGVDAVITKDEAQELLRRLAKKHSVVHTAGLQPHAEYFDFHLNPAPKKLQDSLSRIFRSVRSCRKELSQLRAIKQPEEIEAMQAAIDLTIAAFKQVKIQIASFRHEYEVEAEFTYAFRKSGAHGHAYDPIVAAGKNACTLHYVKNNDRLKKRQLLLMDIGARYKGYAADITRTYSLGEPTKRQKEIHQAVQVAHEQIVALLQPELPVDHYQTEVDRIMKEALVSVGLLNSSKDDKTYRTYFPHAVSHGLGVDVHDSLGAPKRLQKGMVLTVEPGIYIPQESIGVRIEDDILITSDGARNLSGKLSTGL